MLSAWNEVNQRLKQNLKTDADAPYPSLTMTSRDLSGEPPGFPCLYVNSLGEPTEGSDLQNNQCYITSTIELKAYSAEPPAGSQTEARQIMDAAGDVMHRMGYRLIAGPYQDNKGYFLTIARFRRLVGSGDELVCSL